MAREDAVHDEGSQTHARAYAQLQRYNQRKRHTLGCADAHTTSGFMELGENL